MHCNQAHEQLDEFLDGHLDDADTLAVSAHLDDCVHCAAEHASREKIQNLLKALPIDKPEASFLNRAIDKAVADSEAAPASPETKRNRRATDTSRHWLGSGFGNAMAAAFALVFFTAVFLMTGESSPSPSNGYPEVVLATDTVTPVKLMFESAEPLQDARLSLQLPVGIELLGYQDRSNLSWTTDLESGKNVLQLPLVGRISGSNQLIAKLEHPKGTKTFQLRLTVK